MAPRLIEIRQPKANDVVGREFTIAGFGTGFEATVLWRVLDTAGHVVAAGNIQGAGSMGVIRDFGHQVSLGGFSARAAHLMLQVFGDDPSGMHPPGPDLNVVPVTVFTGLEGFRLHEVVSGDNLTKIAREQGQNTTADDIFQANRDRISNPNLIFPGQVFRVPLLA
ncbi:Gmad2 immunoglobulin-like domain-containing protein [Arthrobacter sp. HS15c]|uniref:LysM peptidoglycan-binding domain-containing protein n=1 Tax=Arthrobacter sp. HS15c TaxID=3230279 RepID=UPI0034675FB2